MADNPHILLVNDNPHTLGLLRKVLALRGYRNVSTCSDGLGASQLLGQTPVDLLVTDIHMPHLDGWRLSRMVRAGIFQCSPNTPIIVVSATFDQRIAGATAKEYQVDRFLSLKDYAQLPQVVTESLAAPRRETGRKTLLVIEDSPLNARMIQAVLTDSFDITLAEDGRSGLALWSRHRHDLVLLDLVLPELSGTDVLQGIMAQHPTQPVVVMTAYGTQEIYREMMIHGAADILVKPFSPEQLRKVCDIALRREDYMLLNQQFAVEHREHAAPRQETAGQAAANQANQATQPVRIFTLGRFEIDINGEPLSLRRQSQPKPLELLKVLVAMGGGNVNVEMVAELLWPDSDGDAALVSLNTTLHRLRKTLGDNHAVVRKNNRLALNKALCWVDVEAFEQLAESLDLALNVQRQGDPAAAIETHLPRVLALYQGPFLDQDQETQWSLACRQRLESKWLRLLNNVGRYWEERQEWAKAAELYHRSLESNSLAEEIHQRLMVCYREMARPAEALAVFNRCRKNLAAVGMPPSPTTLKIHRSLRPRS